MLKKEDKSIIEGLVKKGYKHIKLVNAAAVIAGFIMGPLFLVTGVGLKYRFDFGSTVLSDILIFIGVIFSALFIAMIYDVFAKQQGYNSTIGFLLNGEPRLVWIYLECRKAHANGIPIGELTKIPGIFFHVHLLFDNKTKCKFWLNSDEALNLVYLISKENKDISTGWSKELYKQWKTTPKLLLQNPVRSNIVKITIVNAES